MRARAPGFTLIEVLIAIGLFALFIVPLMQTQMLAGQAVLRMKERREAIAIATAQLDYVQHNSTVADSSSDIDGYQVVVSSTHLTGATLPLTRIQVTVGHSGRILASVAAYRM